MRRSADPWGDKIRGDRSRHWIDAPGVRCGRVNEVPSLLTSVRFFPLDNGISEQRTQLWILASKVDDRVGGRLVISTELLHRRRLYNLQRGMLREFCERGEFSPARTTPPPSRPEHPRS